MHRNTFAALFYFIIGLSSIYATDVSGQVTDLFGQSVSAVSITLKQAGGEYVSTTTTDLQGEYTFRNVQTGNYLVITSKQGFQQQRKYLKVADGEPVEVNFGLVVGAITDPLPTILSGVITTTGKLESTPTLIRVQAFFNPALTLEATSDKTGAYKVSIDHPGHYILIVQKIGFLAAVSCFTVAPKLPRKNLVINVTLQQKAQ